MRSPLFSSLKVPDLFQHLLVQNLQPSLNVFFRHKIPKQHYLAYLNLQETVLYFYN